MYTVWEWGIIPHPPEEATTPHHHHRTTPTKKKKNKTTISSSSSFTFTTSPSTATSSFPQASSPLLPPPPPAPHANQPSQVCAEKHRGGPSSHIPPQVTPSHNTILLLYETCRRYLTLTHCWLGVPTPLATSCCEAPSPRHRVHTKRGHESDVTYFIQGCNIVQIMPPPPPPPSPPSTPIGVSVIRSNSPPSFYFANSSTSTTSSSSSSFGGSPSPPLTPPPPASSVHPHRHCRPPHEDKEEEERRVGGGGALQCNVPAGWRRRGSKCTSSIRSRSSPSSQSVILLTVLCLLLAGGADGSELPDRECCDSVPPPPPNYHHATSTTTTTTTPTPKAEFNTSISITSHTAGGVMNCIEARHQCLNDKECKDVLKMLHKVCGPELVACSSTTPTKCQMLLRTLRNFDYLTSCKCSEAHLDFTCHSFRETIFSHPCGLVETDEYPDYIPPLMPNCNDAYDKCKAKGSCLRDYVEFANVCSFSGITCIAQDSEKCMESWSKIRQSSLFGCVCTPPAPMRVLAYGNDLGASDTSLTSYSTLRKGGTQQETCMETYNRTHENPCLAGQQELSKATLVETSQATCHTALEKCMSDEDCRPLLDDVMVWCEHAHCEPDRCRSALQDFYDRVSIIHRLQVAFCVCRQSDPDGECLTAMRKLHPTCAERHSGRDPMKCHKIAEQCRKNSVCREKLREYEQKCAADAMTGRCADTHRSCQKAVMNILGTELHATCVCKGTDFLHQHDCYTWQKLLWSNPCVIESHLMLHKEIGEGASDSLDVVFRRPTLRTTPQPRLPFEHPTPDEEEEVFARPPGGYGIVHEISPDGAPRPSGTSYGLERKGPWDSRRPGVAVGRDRNGDRGGLGIGRNGNHGGIPLGGESGRGGGRPIMRGGYDIPGGQESGGGVRGGGRGRGGAAGVDIGRDSGRRVYGGILQPEGSFPEPKWGGGRNRGGGLSVARNGGRNGGLGSHFGGNQEETGNGGRSGWPSQRVPGLNIAGGRDRGGAGSPYDPSQTGNGYGSRGRGGAGTGHRGTPISIGSPDRGSGSLPRGRDWNNISGGHIGGRPGGNWRNRGELGGVGGGGGIPDDRGFPTTRAPTRRIGHYEPVTPPAFGGITPTPPAMPAPTSQITSTTEIPTTTMPRRTCSIKNVKNEQMMNLEIPEGSRKRIYNTSDCSELCECRAPNRAAKPEAICTTLRCIENKSCNTESAKFPHSAPYYLAYRGVCDCYAGNFICQKPDPKDYTLGPGVYLFLGYSIGEMEILKPVTSKNELDALKQMEDILVKEYNFTCTLTLKNHIGENVIAIAKLDINPDIYMNAFVRQRKEEENCAGPLQKLASKINARPRHSDIMTDAHLSMFILAEVDVNFPQAQTSHASASNLLRPDAALTCLVTLLTTLMIIHHCYLEAMVTPLGVRAT